MSTPSLTRYVCDISIIAQSMVKEPDSPRVKTLLAGVLSSPPLIELWSPDYYQIEAANILWKHVRFQGLPQADATAMLQTLLHLPLKVVAFGTLLPRSLELGLDQGITVYDALYIALAENLKCPLITGDIKQGTAAGALGIKLKPIGDFPPVTT